MTFGTRLKSMAGTGWKISLFLAKVLFGLYLIAVALDSSQSAGNRAVAAAFLVMIWASVLAHEAQERHKQMMARIQALEYMLSGQGRGF